MEQFLLEKWLKDKSRKVVTRDGREVKILKTNRKDGVHPIIFTLIDSNGIEQVHFCNEQGVCTTLPRPNKFDLFFAEEEKVNSIIDELKSYFEKTPKEQVEKDWKEIQDWYTQHFTNEKHNEEEELTEFEKRFIELIRFWMSGNTNPEENLIQSRFDAKELLDIARKEILKSLPKWKKDNNNLSSLTYRLDNRGNGNILLCRKGYAINLIELLNLPIEN